MSSSSRPAVSRPAVLAELRRVGFGASIAEEFADAIVPRMVDGLDFAEALAWTCEDEGIVLD